MSIVFTLSDIWHRTYKWRIRFASKANNTRHPHWHKPANSRINSMVIVRLHVNFPGCISLSHLKRTLCQDSPWKTATKTSLTSQLCKQASKTAKVSYQDNSTQLTSPYSSFRCSSISACCDLAAKYWSTCGQRPPKKQAPSMNIDHLKKLQFSFSQPYRPLPTSKENASPTKRPPPVTFHPPTAASRSHLFRFHLNNFSDFFRYHTTGG